MSTKKSLPPLIAVFGSRKAGRRYVSKKLLLATEHLRPIVVTLYDMVLYSAVATVTGKESSDMTVSELLEPSRGNLRKVASFVGQVNEKVRLKMPKFFVNWLVATAHRYKTQGYGCFIVPDLLYIDDFETLRTDFAGHFELRFVHVFAPRRTVLFFEQEKAHRSAVERLPENAGLIEEVSKVPMLTPELIKTKHVDQFYHFDNSTDGDEQIDRAVERLLDKIPGATKPPARSQPWLALFALILSVISFWYFT